MVIAMAQPLTLAAKPKAQDKQSSGRPKTCTAIWMNPFAVTVRKCQSCEANTQTGKLSKTSVYLSNPDASEGANCSNKSFRELSYQPQQQIRTHSGRPTSYNVTYHKGVKNALLGGRDLEENSVPDELERQKLITMKMGQTQDMIMPWQVRTAKQNEEDEWSGERCNFE